MDLNTIITIGHATIVIDKLGLVNTLVFFLFCIRLAELVELGEFN